MKYTNNITTIINNETNETKIRKPNPAAQLRAEKYTVLL
jgi:hypothetical protein